MAKRKYIFECDQDTKLVAREIPSIKLKSDYVRAFQEGLLEIILDKDLTGDDIRVFLAIISHVEYENKFTMPLGYLGEAIGMKRQNVSKSVKKLLQKGYLNKDGNQGQVNHYMVDPRIITRCRNFNYKKLVEHWDELPVAR